MMTIEEPKPKDLVWVVSARRDTRELPKSVQRTFGVATPPFAKPLKGQACPGIFAAFVPSTPGG